MSKVFYGWKLLGVFWIIMIIGSAFPLYGGGVLNAAMARDFSTTGSSLALPMSILQFIFGLGAPVAALFINRYGIRAMLYTGSLFLIGGSVLMATWVSSWSQATFVFGIIVGAGFTTVGGIVTQVGVTRWFLRRRALAFAILFSAPGIGGFFIAPFVNQLVLSFDGNWRVGWWFNVLLGMLVIVMTGLLVKEYPADIGEVVDGAPEDEAEAQPDQQRGSELPAFITREAWAVGNVYRNVAYWLLILASTGVNAGMTLYFAVGITHLQSLGHSATAGSWALAVFGISALIAKVILGLFGDRIDPRYIWIGMVAAFALGLFMVANADATYMLMLFPVFMGIGFGGNIACLMAVMSNYYGKQVFPTIVGMAVAITTCTGALMPILASRLVATLGSYSPVFLVFAGWCLAGIVIMAMLRIPVMNRSVTAEVTS